MLKYCDDQIAPLLRWMLIFLYAMYIQMYRGWGIYDVKGSVCFVKKFALPSFSPPHPSVVQISKQKTHWTLDIISPPLYIRNLVACHPLTRSLKMFDETSMRIALTAHGTHWSSHLLFGELIFIAIDTRTRRKREYEWTRRARARAHQPSLDLAASAAPGAPFFTRLMQSQWLL